jgi:hypothetical protein
MKKCIPAVAAMAALVAACLCLKFTPPLLDNTRLAWSNWKSQTARHNFLFFYFSKRQWLADARTVVAGIRFLFLSVTASPANPMEVVNIPPLPPLRPGISTNLFGRDRPGFLWRRAGHRLSKAGRIIGPDWLSSSEGLPPLFAFADFPSNGSYGLHFSGSDVTSYLPEDESWVRRTPHRTSVTPPGLPNSRHDSMATNLLGA